MELRVDAMAAAASPSNAPGEGKERAVGSLRDRFFDCVFVWTPRELIGDAPYVVFEDEASQPFAARLIRACRGESGFRGVVRDAAAIPSDAIVICEAPVWRRAFEMLAAAGVCGDRARVLLYFDVDPSGFWDFAEACGDQLRAIFTGGVTTANVEALADYLETWAGCRVVQGRIAPYPGFYTRDYYPLHQKNAASIVRIMAALADDESRAAYARILFGTTEQVFASFASSVWGEQQYMAIVRPKPGDVIVNCGVGRGWELPYFLARLKGEGRIHNIDPNMVYFSSHSAGFIDFFKDMITDHPIVVGDRDGTITLSVADAGMVISTEGQPHPPGATSETYPLRSLDSLMAEGMADRVDYLKMDVEGGERAILRGALDTIRKHRPKLAVAIYHEPEHFWDYPEFLLDHLENYRLYIRQYGYSRFETLLYAIPAEDVATSSGGERLPAPDSDRQEPSPVDAPSVLAYFRDAADHKRPFYSKKLRPLTRSFGVSWPTADITPGPDLGVDEVDAVIETPSAALIIARHFSPRGEHLARAGYCTSPMDLSWTQPIKVAADTVCVAIESDDGSARFLTCSPDAETCAVVAIDGPRLSRIARFTLDRTPLAAYWTHGALTLLCDGATAGTFQKVRPLAPNAERVVEVDAPPGRFLGTAAVRSLVNGEARDAGVLVMHEPGADAATLYEPTAEGYARAGALVHDPRLDLVSTIFDTRIIAKPPTMSWWRRGVLAAADQLGVREQLTHVSTALRRARGRC